MPSLRPRPLSEHVLGNGVRDEDWGAFGSQSIKSTHVWGVHNQFEPPNGPCSDVGKLFSFSPVYSTPSSLPEPVFGPIVKYAEIL